MSKPGKSRVIIHHKAPECVGCAYCAEVIPQYFKLDEDGMAILLNGEEKGGLFHAEGLAIDIEDIKEAARGCATNIISVDRASG